MELFEDIFDDLDYGISDTDLTATEMEALEGIVGIEGIHDFSAIEGAKTETEARAIRTIPAFLHMVILHGYNTGVMTQAAVSVAALNGATVSKLGVATTRFMASLGVLPITLANGVIVSLICLAITSPAIIDSTVRRLEKKVEKLKAKGDNKKIEKLEDKIKVLKYLSDNFRGFSHEQDLISQLNKPGICASAVNTINTWLRSVGEVEIKKLDRKIAKAEEKGKDKRVMKFEAKKKYQQSLALDSVLHMCDEDFDPATESVVEYYFEDEAAMAMAKAMESIAYENDYNSYCFDPLEDLF